MQLSPRRWAVLAMIGALVGGLGASASACANLATLSLSTGSGRPGTHVTFTGSSFAVPRAGTGLTATPVVVQWEGEDGPVLAQVTPDRAGTISASFTVPEVRPGEYVIIATQKVARHIEGAPPEQAPVYFDEPGTPARASFEVLGPGAVPVIRAPSAESVDTTDAQGQFDSTVWLVLTAAFGAVAMSLFGGGLIAFIHQLKKSKEPARARWVPPGWYQ